MDRRQCLKTIASFGCCSMGSAFGCRSAPITGRKQLILIPEQQEISMGQQAFADVIKEEEATTNAAFQVIVDRIGHRIAAVAGRDDYQWEFKVLHSDQQNAFCLPGGKVAVYEGILPVCENEAGLAVVMSHEISHALARHGSERMSQNAAVQGFQNVIGYATRTTDQVRREAILKGYGMASQYGVLLPYSRKHESEADHMGLILMAKAGYDPSEAPRFWDRFGSMGGEKPPEFLSTHPSDQRRSADLEKLLPEAMDLYTQASDRVGLGAKIDA